MEIVTGTLYRSKEDQGNKDWKLIHFGKQNPIDYDLEFEKINDKSGRTNLVLEFPKYSEVEATASKSDVHQNLMYMGCSCHGIE
jgi:hypothetical protein